MLQAGRPSTTCDVAQSRQFMKKGKKEKNEWIKEKEKLIVVSCTWNIRPSPNKNQESQIQKKMCWKNCININDTSNLEPKANPFKTILTWEEMLQAGKPSTTCNVVQSRLFKKKRKNERKKQKKNWLSYYALEKFV